MLILLLLLSISPLSLFRNIVIEIVRLHGGQADLAKPAPLLTYDFVALCPIAFPA